MSTCGTSGDECRVCVEAPVYQNSSMTGTLEVAYLNGQAIFNDIIPTTDHSAVTLVFSLCYNQEMILIFKKKKILYLILAPNVH